MQRRNGTILRTKIPPELAAIPYDPKKVSEAFIDCQIRLHAIDVKTTGLIALGKPEGFIERQLRGWTDRWNRAKTEEFRMGSGSQRPQKKISCCRHCPHRSQRRALHTTNVNRQLRSHRSRPRLGDDHRRRSALRSRAYAVLTGLGHRSRISRHGPGIKPPPPCQAGIPAISFVARYAEKTSRDLKHLGYHEVLGVFKLAVILQQIYYRFHVGQT